jgi:hypothetical protein
MISCTGDLTMIPVVHSEVHENDVNVAVRSLSILIGRTVHFDSTPGLNHRPYPITNALSATTSVSDSSRLAALPPCQTRSLQRHFKPSTATTSHNQQNFPPHHQSTQRDGTRRPRRRLSQSSKSTPRSPSFTESQLAPASRRSV